MSKSLFIDFMEKMLAFPLWIKQTIFLNLSNDLTNYLSNEFLDLPEGELFHIYKPALSDLGQNELLTKESKFDESIYAFMNCCSKGMSLIEIAIENNFTMEEVAKAFTFCKTSGFFSNEVPNLVSAIAGFIAGKYRTGEYFIRAGKMTIDGGNYTSIQNPLEVEPNGNGTTTSGAALGISQHTTNLPIDVIVNGGTFTGAYAIWEKDVQDETARDQIKLTVNDGIFNGAIYSQNNPNAIVKGTYSDPAALNYLADDADVKIDVQQDVNSGFFTLPASAKAEIALNGKRVTFTAASESGHGSKIYGNLVISGSGYIGDPTHSTVGYLFDMYGNSTLLVEGDATIESGLTCIQLSDNAHATVKGGKWIGDEWNNKYWTINKIDSSKDSAVVEVMGGEFYKFDPSNSATENPVQNWVPEGYTVTSENDWYKVTAE